MLWLQSRVGARATAAAYPLPHFPLPPPCSLVDKGCYLLLGSLMGLTVYLDYGTSVLRM